MRLVLGRAGTGKNRFVMQDINAAASKDCRILLLVPEQSSFSYEKRLFMMLGANRADFVEVRSFSRLADDILRAAGKTATERLNDAARATLLRRALLKHRNNITYFKQGRVDTAFYKMTADVIGECKNAAITPEILMNLSEKSASKLTGIKLKEISLLFSEYESLISDKYRDDSDLLTAAAKAASECSFFLERTVFIDGFTGFTEPEYKILESIAADSKNVTITLLCDKLDTAGGVFETVRINALRIMDINKKTGAVSEIVYLDKKMNMADGISSLEEYLAGKNNETKTDGVYFIRAKNPYEEVENAAAEIVDLVRNRGYNFSDIVIITRDTERYRTAIKRIFRLFDIPYFTDWTVNESFFAPAVFIKSALSLLEELNAENLLALLKTLLTSIPETDIAAFENYIYVWGLDGKDLLNPFTRNPDGFSDTMSDQSVIKQRQAENTRKTVIEWVTKFVNDAGDKTADMVIKEIYLLMQRCGAVDAIADRYESERAVYLLEQLNHILSGENMTPSEISQTAEILFSETYVGEIPNMLEQVQVGTADRVRAGDPKVTFVMGLNEGRFPRTDFELPLLSYSERDFINSNGGNLSQSFENLSFMEELHLYNALTCASERIYLCYPAESTTGETLRPTIKIADYLDIFKPPAAPSLNIRFSRIVNQITAKKAYLESKFTKDHILSGVLSEIVSLPGEAASEPEYSLSDGGLRKRNDGLIVFSPTQIENFMGCRFRYFLRYIARINPIEQAKISPLQAGNFIHSVVERVYKKTGGNLVFTDDFQLSELCGEAARQYTLDYLQNDDSKLSSRMIYQISRLSEQARRLLGYLRDEQRQSGFTTVDVELQISDTGGIPPRTLTLPDGETVVVYGRIDRVDIAEIGGKKYIRVVDYKTGIKDFSLDDVCSGLNIQMLIYLFSVTDNGTKRYAGTIFPAGVLYMPSDPYIPVLEDEVTSVKQPYRMDGLVLNDSDVAQTMEYGLNKVYIPVSVNSKGLLGPSSKLADLEEMGRIKTCIDNIIVDMVNLLKAGDISANPITKSNSSVCDYCEYTAVCRRDRINGKREIVKGAGISMLKGGDNDA